MNEQTKSRRWFTLHVATFLFVLLLTFVRYAPSPPKGPGVPHDEFSAGRVRALLGRIVRPGVPHPTGSLDHARVRDVVIDEFRSLGFEPQLQETFAYHEIGVAEQVQNIVVHVRGTVGEEAVALVAHYDSVPAGPGVADDGSGVGAILEIARLFAQGPPPRNDVIFLITDAEELGLFGARAFAAEHPLMAKIRVVLNWEARGTRGPSFMFETGPDNLGLVRFMAQHCRRSISTSVFPAIYERLPNDTDLTAFKRHGKSGMNFAFIGGVPHYHTPRDNMENLDVGSVQHQGDHFATMARLLANARLDELPDGDAVFFDVLGWFTVWWPERWNLAMAIAVAALAAFLLALSCRRSRASPLRVACGLLAAVIVLLVAAFAGEVACRLAALCSGEAVPWWAWPQPICLVLWCIGIGVPLAFWCWGRRGVSGEVFSATLVVVWSVLGLVLAVYLAGGSYLFTVPAAVACAAHLVAFWRRTRWEVANLLFLTAACLLWLPMVRGMIDALGVGLSAGQSVPLALLGSVIVPSAGRDLRIRGLLVLLCILGTSGLAVATLVPAYSEQWPQPVSIVQIENDREARLEVTAEVGHIPDCMRLGAGPGVGAGSGRRMVLEAGRELEPPRVEVVSEEKVEGGRRLKLCVTPAAGQHRIVIRGNPDLGSTVIVDGHPVQVPLRSFALNLAERTDTEIELTVAGEIELTVVGYLFHLPPSAERLRELRPAWAVPRHDGDGARVARQLTL